MRCYFIGGPWDLTCREAVSPGSEVLLPDIEPVRLEFLPGTWASVSEFTRHRYSLHRSYVGPDRIPVGLYLYVGRVQ